MTIHAALRAKAAARCSQDGENGASAHPQNRSGGALARSREAATRQTISSTLALLIGTGAVFAFPTEEIPTSEPAYLAKVKTAAPEEIVAKASIVMMQDGKPRSLQTGTNGFTCMIDGAGTIPKTCLELRFAVSEMLVPGMADAQRRNQETPHRRSTTVNEIAAAGG